MCFVQKNDLKYYSLMRATEYKLALKNKHEYMYLNAFGSVYQKVSNLIPGHKAKKVP